MAPHGSPMAGPFSFRLASSRPRNVETKEKVSSSPRRVILSLGTGSLSPDGSVRFQVSPRKRGMFPFDKKKTSPSPTPSPLASSGLSKQMNLICGSFKFYRTKSSFLRVADLDMNDTSCSTVASEASFPNYHHPAADPPPGVEHDPKEQWIALSNGDGSHAPIAPIAVERLADFGLVTSVNEGMWVPDYKTDKMLKKADVSEWMKSTFKPGLVRKSSDAAPDDMDVLVWSGNFKHGFYGSDLPAIRAAGIVNMSADALMNLLVDSNRVKEYNKLSLGRDDLVVFSDDISSEGPFGRSITKVMKSETRPPMVRKTLVFISVLHAKELIDGSGYLIVTRAVHHPEEDKALANSIKSEILMGVNVIRRIQGAEGERCLMINVNHIRSPMVPLMVAKRIGVSAAVGFINDIRALC